MNGYEYPAAKLDVLPFNTDFESLYPYPRGVRPDSWPPQQAKYLQVYLSEIGCQTLIVEHHYIDRVFMHDGVVYYSRSLRSYPNFTRRVHFFDEAFNCSDWKAMIDRAARGKHTEVEETLQKSYLGFSVIRPLPGSPIGRTILPARSLHEPEDTDSSFGTVRPHKVHLAGFTLRVCGVPFQSQDQSVSACATTALWSALDCVAATEEITVASPASITESATRYPLQEGRPFPTEGLTVRQICEATRAAGFSPLVIRSKSVTDDAIQILGYAVSGFAPVLALLPAADSGAGHAVCCVGTRQGQTAPQTNPALSYREAASGLRGLYIHDDRLGPYAFAGLRPLTDSESNIRTCVSIEWPDAKPVDDWFLHAIVVPVPQKLRLTLSRLRKLGLPIAQAIGVALGEPRITLNCRFGLSRSYAERMYDFGLSSDGLYQAVCGTTLSRYIGLIEIAGPFGPLFDVVADTTETTSESAALVCIKRSGFLDTHVKLLQAVGKHLGVMAIL